MIGKEESTQATDDELRGRCTKKASWDDVKDEMQRERRKYLWNDSSPKTDAVVYAFKIQMLSHATNNQDRQSGKSDENDGEVGLKQGIFLERHAQSTMESDPKVLARTQLSGRNERTAYRPQS